MDFECVIAEELCDPIVSFHDLSLRLFVSTDNNNGGIFGKHHLEIVLLLLMPIHLNLGISLCY